MIPQHLERLTLKKKKTTINNVGTDWEQLELIYIYGGNENIISIYKMFCSL